LFQSLKRDVAYFHVCVRSEQYAVSIVSIAQARCGLLPLFTQIGVNMVKSGVFQSLKRDVAYFHNTRLMSDIDE